MSKEAEKLAHDCEESADIWANEIDTRRKAAALLRRQAEQIRELREALAELKCSVNFKAALIVADAEVMKVALADDQLWVAVDRASAALSNTKEAE